MKRFAVLIAFASMFVAAMPVHAALCPSGFTSLCNLTPDKTGSVVGVVLQYILIIAILSCIFFLIWGGVRWISSGGDKGKIDQARGQIVAALVGLVIALLAYFIVNIVLTFFTGTGIAGLSIPTLL